jgi:hypothetical protein
VNCFEIFADWKPRFGAEALGSPAFGVKPSHRNQCGGTMIPIKIVGIRFEHLEQIFGGFRNRGTLGD